MGISILLSRLRLYGEQLWAMEAIFEVLISLNRNTDQQITFQYIVEYGNIHCYSFTFIKSSDYLICTIFNDSVYHTVFLLNYVHILISKGHCVCKQDRRCLIDIIRRSY